jgi:hypothetical protein
VQERSPCRKPTCRHVPRSAPVAVPDISSRRSRRWRNKPIAQKSSGLSAAPSTASGAPAPRCSRQDQDQRSDSMKSIRWTGRNHPRKPYPEEPCEARRLEGWTQARSRLGPSFETRASFDKLRSALLRTRRMDCVDMIRTSERPQCPPDNSLLFPAPATPVPCSGATISLLVSPRNSLATFSDHCRFCVRPAPERADSCEIP